LAEAMMIHGLDRRIAFGLLGLPWVGNSLPRVYLVFGGITTVLSMWLSNTATTAMMVPIALGIIGEIREMSNRQGNQHDPARFSMVATGLLLMLAYGASIGGLGTPIGPPPNLIGIGTIRTQLEIDLSFVKWMSFAVPATVVMFIVLSVIL